MKLRFTDTALAEADEILSYIARENETAAAQVAAAIDRTLAAILKRPQSAPTVFQGQLRAKLVERYQYRVFYEIRGDEVIVRNIRSTKRLRPWEDER
jgi:plasmid stabilization system protein ParE